MYVLDLVLLHYQSEKKFAEGWRRRYGAAYTAHEGIILPLIKDEVGLEAIEKSQLAGKSWCLFSFGWFPFLPLGEGEWNSEREWREEVERENWGWAALPWMAVGWMNWFR